MPWSFPEAPKAQILSPGEWELAMFFHLFTSTDPTLNQALIIPCLYCCNVSYPWPPLWSFFNTDARVIFWRQTSDHCPAQNSSVAPYCLQDYDCSMWWWWWDCIQGPNSPLRSTAHPLRSNTHQPNQATLLPPILFSLNAFVHTVSQSLLSGASSSKRSSLIPPARRSYSLLNDLGFSIFALIHLLTAGFLIICVSHVSF